MGADAIRRVETEKGEIAYDSDMPMRSLESIMAAANSGDLASLMGGLAVFVKEWPFEGDPGDIEAWRDLRRSEFNAVTTAVIKDIGDLGNE